MAETTPHGQPGGYAFGPFRLYPRERKLLENGQPVHLSDRPFDILVALVRRAGVLVTKNDLLSEVWPGVTVGEGSLRVHIVALRRALRETDEGARYIVNVVGQGYSFAAPVSEVEGGPPPDVPHATAPPAALGVPQRSSPIIGRDEVITLLSAQLSTRRLTTIVGPGGVGKSTVAHGIAEALRSRFEEVRFFDLASLSDADLLPTALSLLFDVRVVAGDAIAMLAREIAGRHILLVLDGCEHLIETAALIVERLMDLAPELQILATSREALRLSQERVYRLAPLGLPTVPITRVEDLLAYPAAQLFVERALAAWQDFHLDDDNAVTIAAICNALDGLPLAIELAVGQLAFLGFDGLARGLADPLSLLARGRRTASPRQQTLRATLDWSYQLLSSDEQHTLCRLSVFSDRFILEGAVAVATCPRLEAPAVRDATAGLVAKSLIVAEYDRDVVSYRLLDTTRAYSRTLLDAAGDLDFVSGKHARYIEERMQLSGDTAVDQILMPHIPNRDVVGDLRAALAWSYADPDETALFRSLAKAATFVFVQGGSFEEARMHLQAALDRLAPEERGTSAEFDLRLYMNGTSPFTGASDENLTAILSVAEMLDDPIHIVRALELTFLIRLRVSDYRGALDVARRIDSLLASLKESAPPLVVDWMEGVAAHYLGQYGPAAARFEAVLDKAQLPEAVRYSGDPLAYTLCFSSRVSWLTGLEQEAQERAERALALVQDFTNPVYFCTVVTWLSQLWLWIGDLDRVETLCAQMNEVTVRYKMDTPRAMAAVWLARMEILRGRPAEGMARLRHSRRHLERNQQDMLTPVIHAAFAEGLSAMGDTASALREIDEGVARIAVSGGEIFLPELMLIRARIQAAAGGEFASEAMAGFEAAMACAASQGARAWEARTALAWARHALALGRRDIAHAVLVPVCERPDLDGVAVRPELLALLAEG
ncbi:MAG: transcriptional regulatory protein [Bradyrhizobium sp.]|nr:transcriptional regulatory protein [Bradyrhizobium sp.]